MYLHICRDEKGFPMHLAGPFLYCTFLWSWGKEKDADCLPTSLMSFRHTHINPMWFYTLLSETPFLCTMLCLSCGQIRMFLIRNSRTCFHSWPTELKSVKGQRKNSCRNPSFTSLCCNKAKKSWKTGRKQGTHGPVGFFLHCGSHCSCSNSTAPFLPLWGVISYWNITPICASFILWENDLMWYCFYVQLKNLRQ